MSKGMLRYRTQQLLLECAGTTTTTSSSLQQERREVMTVVSCFEMMYFFRTVSCVAVLDLQCGSYVCMLFTLVFECSNNVL